MSCLFVVRIITIRAILTSSIIISSQLARLPRKLQTSIKYHRAIDYTVQNSTVGLWGLTYNKKRKCKTNNNKYIVFIGDPPYTGPDTPVSLTNASVLPSGSSHNRLPGTIHTRELHFVREMSIFRCLRESTVTPSTTRRLY